MSRVSKLIKTEDDLKMVLDAMCKSEYEGLSKAKSVPKQMWVGKALAQDKIVQFFRESFFLEDCRQVNDEDLISFFEDRGYACFFRQQRYLNENMEFRFDNNSIMFDVNESHHDIIERFHRRFLYHNSGD